ncbi:hypothetical protein [Alloactinosynnema sp. L-07]|uniref:YncE family protein n=1 Tax=Alloactinosynnema sp. L-07 TaxID=1653480 RepID=UPI00065EFCF0|nr:YncE family protein [Alloactinosynnema sp. L-07]CRK62003.1 hypothetical protein [Alloactinosynnema sp. L-07]
MTLTKPTRRTALGMAAIAALAFTGSVAFADQQSPATATQEVPQTVPYGVGAYNGYLNNIPAPFASGISNNSMAVSPDQTIAVVTNSETQYLRVLRLSDGFELHKIGGYTSPRNILFHPDGHSITVTDDTLGVLDEISMSTYKVIKRLPLGAGVMGTAQSQSADGITLWATNHAAGTVTVIDPVLQRPTAVITGFTQPRQGIAVAPKQNQVYVTDIGANHITRVDMATNTKVDDIGSFVAVRGLSFNNEGTKAFVADSGKDGVGDSVSIIDTTTTPPTQKKIELQGKRPYGAVLSHDQKTLLTGNHGDNSLTTLDPETGAVLGNVGNDDRLVGPRQAIVFSDDAPLAWVLNADLTIAVIDLSDPKNPKIVNRLG